MESAEKKRPGDILTGALIGLARTTYSLKDRRYRQGSNMCSVCSGKTGMPVRKNLPNS